MQLGLVKTTRPEGVVEFPVLTKDSLPDDRLRATTPDGIGAIPTLPVDEAEYEIARVQFPDELRVIVPRLFLPEFVVGVSGYDSSELRFFEAGSGDMERITYVQDVDDAYGAHSWSIEDFVINPTDGTMALVNDDHLWKMDENGQRLWHYTFDGDYHDNYGGEHYLSLAKDGSVVVGMTSENRNYLARFSPTGDVMWERWPEEPANGISIDRYGDLIVTVQNRHVSKRNLDTGESIWKNNTADLQQAMGAEITYKNGYKIWVGSGTDHSQIGHNTIRRFDGDGNQLDDLTIPEVDIAYGVQAVGDGVVCITETYPGEKLVAYDDTDDHLWTHRPDGHHITRLAPVPADATGDSEPQVFVGHDEGLDKVGVRSGNVTEWDNSKYRAVASQWGDYSTYPNQWE